jgi:hypothetical protein
MKHVEMRDILQYTHKYVPSKCKEQQMTFSTGETLTVDAIDEYEILLRGDLLSSFRA